jgi:putative phosphoribosyl transferase
MEERRMAATQPVCTLPFFDRRDAGRCLATHLHEYARKADVLVLALPRGGVPVAAEIAAELDVPLDVLIVRKLGLPWQPELAAGAIAPEGVLVRNPLLATCVPNLERVVQKAAQRERPELDRREASYRRGKPALRVKGKTVILVDDGIATGATMQAAIMTLRAMQARSIVVAVPIAPPDTLAQLELLADRVLCLETPEPFDAVGRWYRHFPQLSDQDVIALLAAHGSPAPPGASGHPPA